MLIAAGLIAALNIFLAIASLMAKHKRRKAKKEKAVYLPFYLAKIGIVLGIFFSFLAVLQAVVGIWTFVSWGVVPLVFSGMMTAYLNCVIRYDHKGFTVRNMFGIQRQCSYGEVEGIRSGKKLRIFFPGHSVLIRKRSLGAYGFLCALVKGYKKATGAMLPHSASFRRKWDPMNGHLDSPWAHFIYRVIFGLFWIALGVSMIFFMTSETDPADVITSDVQFCAYEVNGEDLVLYAEGESVPYKIRFFQKYGEAVPMPEELCSGEVYSVGIVRPYHHVKTLTGPDGTKHITLETERKAFRESYVVAACMLSIFCMVSAYICYLGIAVARNPERYSEKVQLLFYKRGRLH